MNEVTQQLVRALLDPVREFVAGELQKWAKRNPYARLGTIPATYTTGLPQVVFDGEDAASGRRYPHLTSYTPVADDRVMLQRCGSTWVIVGKVKVS